MNEDENDDEHSAHSLCAWWLDIPKITEDNRHFVFRHSLCSPSVGLATIQCIYLPVFLFTVPDLILLSGFMF